MNNLSVLYFTLQTYLFPVPKEKIGEITEKKTAITYFFKKQGIFPHPLAWKNAVLKKRFCKILDYEVKCHQSQIAFEQQII